MQSNIYFIINLLKNKMNNSVDYRDYLTMNPVVGGTAAKIYKLEQERPINSYNTRGDFVGEYRGCE